MKKVVCLVVIIALFLPVGVVASDYSVESCNHDHSHEDYIDFLGDIEILHIEKIAVTSNLQKFQVLKT